MTICLQGGGEFTAGCRELDKAMLRRASGGRLLMLPLGEEPGEAYATLGETGRRWYSGLGVSEVALAGDPRDGVTSAASVAAAVREAAVVVLAGSSVSGVLEAVLDTPLGEALREAQSAGGLVVGAGAGSRALCEWVESDAAPGGSPVVRGLGLVPATALLPHYASGLRPEWITAVPEDVLVLGLRDCSGVVVHKDLVTALGAGRTSLISGTDTIAVLDPGTTRDVWWLESVG